MHKQNLVKFCPFFSKDIEWKRKSDLKQGPPLCYEFAKMTGNYLSLDLIISMHIQNLLKFYPFFSKDIERKGNSDTNRGP